MCGEHNGDPQQPGGEAQQLGVGGKQGAADLPGRASHQCSPGAPVPGHSGLTLPHPHQCIQRSQPSQPLRQHAQASPPLKNAAPYFLCCWCPDLSQTLPHLTPSPRRLAPTHAAPPAPPPTARLRHPRTARGSAARTPGGPPAPQHPSASAQRMGIACVGVRVYTWAAVRSVARAGSTGALIPMCTGSVGHAPVPPRGRTTQSGQHLNYPARPHHAHTRTCWTA